jgi:hypothetical protein
MPDDSAPTAAAREYAAAYAAHYFERDLAMLQLYKKLIASHAGSREAGYRRSQVRKGTRKHGWIRSAC